MTITGDDALDDIISGHPAHDEGHILYLVRPMQEMREEKCNGCKEPIKKGTSCRYRCGDENCDIKALHACCAVKPDTVNPDHEKYRDDQFKFVNKAGVRGGRCGICGGNVAGFVYYGRADVYLHPCCALQRHGEEEQQRKRKCKCNNAVNRNITSGRHRTPTHLIN